MTYIYKCQGCGAHYELPIHGFDETNCPRCGKCCLRRDYKAEGFGIGSGVKVSRDGTIKDQAKLFLPDNKDFAGPSDPDGTKGMREWRENHTPKGAKPHWPGEVEKKVM